MYPVVDTLKRMKEPDVVLKVGTVLHCVQYINPAEILGAERAGPKDMIPPVGVVVVLEN